MNKITSRDYERITAMIQEAFKDHELTKIHRNKKIYDRDGIEREFDVYIEAIANGYSVNIAIECKMYKKRKVSIDKIDSFLKKCSDFPEINKMAFVSFSGYQKGAKEKALLNGVKLFDLGPSHSSSPVSITIRPIESTRIVTQMRITFSKVANKKVTFNSSILYDGKICSLGEFIKIIIPKKVEPLIVHTSILHSLETKKELVEVDLNGLAWVVDVEHYAIDKMIFTVETNYEYVENDPNFMTLTDSQQDKEIAHVYDSNYLEDGKITSVYIPEQNKLNLYLQHPQFENSSKTLLKAWDIRNNDGVIEWVELGNS